MREMSGYSEGVRVEIKNWFRNVRKFSEISLFATNEKGSEAEHKNQAPLIKGTESWDIIQIFGQKFTVIVINKNLSWFSNFSNPPLMRCRHCFFVTQPL